jgi:hypothetical protein
MKSKIIAIAVLAVLVGFGWMTASAQGNRTVLRIDNVKITKTECGKPLEFDVTIKNAGANGFNREAAVIIKTGTNHIGHQFVMSIAAGATITDVQATLNKDFLADCCKEVCFEISLGATTDGGVVPEWDKVVYKICTKPGNVVVIKR